MATERKTKATPDSQKNSFEAEAERSSPGFIAELREFLLHNKKWWLTPIIVILLLLGLLLLLSSSVIAPFIYPLF